ncbi:hypothetical protein [Moorena producens]|uniref:hypothetical protein n=1 Tax=Moorena producens TaxID=1155739 RepID=UPI001E476D22|nr:hypothetical protein [Moorena producens]
MAATHIRFDWAIKKQLRDKANYVVLEGFISELLGEVITIESILESDAEVRPVANLIRLRKTHHYGLGVSPMSDCIKTVKVILRHKTIN